jgi:toxin secretion/phage lysis holin
MKETICTIVAVLGGWIANALGGWDMAATTLFFFMAVDYITGIIVAGVFHKSKKTNTGSLKSLVGFKGLCRKFNQLFLVAVGYRMDLLLETNYIREAIALGFIANEALSIIENAGLMGIPLPPVLIKMVDVLSERANADTVKEE